MTLDVEIIRRAATKGNWSKVLEMFKGQKELRTAKITATGDTILHMAILGWRTDIVKPIVDLICGIRISNNNETSAPLLPITDPEPTWPDDVFGVKNEKGNTPMHLAASSGMDDVCKTIGDTCPSLIVARNMAGETPLFLAALNGRRDTFLSLHYLLETPKVLLQIPKDVPQPNFPPYIRNNGDTILHCAIAEGHIEVAIEIFHLYRDLVIRGMKRNKEGLSPLHLLAAQRSAFKSSSLHDELPFLGRLIYQNLKRAWCRVEQKNEATKLEHLKKNNWQKTYLDMIELLLRSWYPIPFILDSILPDNIYKRKERHTWTLQIMEELLKHTSDEDISQMIPLRTQDNKDKELECGTKIIETPLMIAVKNGVVEMVEEILELFPNRIKDVNHEGKNILMLAIEYRQTKVYEFLRNRKWLSETLFEQVDHHEGNNALHLAARIQSNWLDVGEKTWFEFVKNSSPRCLLEGYNKKMESPEEVFGDSYVELTKSKLEWAAKTSEACSVVSILVASVAFATRSSVPGGYDEHGYAILRTQSPEFILFVNEEMTALFFSLVSTIFFLSILASSPSQSVHSWSSISFKLFLGLYFTLMSICFLWLSFFDGLFFALNDGTKPSPRRNDIVLLVLTLVFAGVVLYQFIRLGRPLLSGFQRWSSSPAPSHKTSPPIMYRKSKNKENEKASDLNGQN